MSFLSFCHICSPQVTLKSQRSLDITRKKVNQELDIIWLELASSGRLKDAIMQMLRNTFISQKRFFFLVRKVHGLMVEKLEGSGKCKEAENLIIPSLQSNQNNISILLLGFCMDFCVFNNAAIMLSCITDLLWVLHHQILILTLWIWSYYDLLLTNDKTET